MEVVLVIFAEIFANLSEVSEQVNMNGQIVIRGSDHFVIYGNFRCGGRKYWRKGDNFTVIL